MTTSAGIKAELARFPSAVAVAVLSTVTLVAFAQPAVGQGTATASELVEAMREGGHVIFIRHAQTEHDYADQIDATMGDCSTQRTLSEAGWHEARMIGEATCGGKRSTSTP